MFPPCFQPNPDCPLPNNKSGEKHNGCDYGQGEQSADDIFCGFLRLNFIFKILTFLRIIGKAYRKADVRTLADFTDNFKS